MTSVPRLARLKDRSPRAVRDVANHVTRTYGVASAHWRPYPDFLIVGTKRGGTTSLWNYLLDHDQVLPMFPAPRLRKSSDYFFVNLHRSDRWYRSHFHTVPYRRRRADEVGTVVTGEASPYYMYGPHIPAHIARIMPQVRLIVLLRDPVNRAYGHYQERVKEGTEDLSFSAALEAEPQRLAVDEQRRQNDPTYYSRAHDLFSYRDRGIYLPQLQRLAEHFPADQLLVVRSEDLYTDPQTVYDDVARFLGIRPRPLRDARQHNYIPRSPIDPEVAATLRAFYQPHNRRLFEYLGRDLGWPKSSSPSRCDDCGG